MSDLAANLSPQIAQEIAPYSAGYIVKNAEQQYAQNELMLNVQTGYAEKYESATGYQRSLGLADLKILGDGTERNTVMSFPTVQKDVTVATGGAGTIADLDKSVYAGSDNPSDRTFTRPTTGAAFVGYTRKRGSATVFDVVKPDDALMRHIAFDGMGRRRIFLGTFALSDGSSGAYLLKSFTLRGLGRLKRFHGVMAKRKAATNSETCVLQPELDGVLVSGGQMTVSTLAISGGQMMSGSAITAGNLHKDGSALKVKQISGVHTSGWINLFIESEY